MISKGTRNDFGITNKRKREKYLERIGIDVMIFGEKSMIV
jgi:hypothetical protein